MKKLTKQQLISITARNVSHTIVGPAIAVTGAVSVGISYTTTSVNLSAGAVTGAVAVG